MTRPSDGPARRGRSSAWTAALTLLTVGVVLAACNDADRRSRPSTPVDAGLRVSAAQTDPLIDYELTVARVTALNRAQQALYRLSRRNPEPLERLAEEVEDYHPEEYELAVRAIEREPTVSQTLTQAGISPRDYYLTQRNLVNAVFVAEARKKGRADHLPAVSEANVEFVQKQAVLVKRVMTERRPRGE